MQNISLQKKIENFSRLSDQECALFLQSHLLEALEIEEPTYLEWEILAKFIFLEYVLRDDLCKLFNYYFKRNAQTIGGVPISEWLKRYLVKYAGIGRDPDTFFRYASTESEIQELGEKDQIRLMRIFRLYDYFLIEPIASMDDVAAENIMRFPMYLSESLAEIQKQISSQGSYAKQASSAIATASEKLAIKQAVQKYPKLGEQLITSAPVKLKNFDRPVRPSVRNWIYDYTSHLGQTGHSSMDRMNYLFRSENTARLTSPEREKLGIILRSFDENTPLPIDGERQEIVFENLATRNTQHITQPLKQSPAFPPPKADRLAPEVRNSSKSNFLETPQGQTASPQHQTFVKPYLPTTTQLTKNIVSAKGNQISDGKFQDSAPGADKMQFVNPYPSPAAPDSQHSEADDNIANVRFSEGVTRKYEPPAKTISQSSAFPSREPSSRDSSKPSFSRNIIRPHFRSPEDKKPEPKIEGNIVDLRGDQ